MSLLVKSLTEIKLGNYGTAASSALSDPKLLPQVQNYKRQVASRMMPLDRNDISRKIPEASYLVSRKIDGEFTVLIYDDGELVSLNPGGKVRFGLPFQEEAKQILDGSNIQQAMIAGELYVTNDQDRRPRVHDVASLVRQPDDVEDLQRVRFAVFDWIQLDSEPVERHYDDIWKKIETTFSGGKLIHPVETVSIKGHREITALFNQWVDEEGAEGIVVRSETAGNFKIKPRYTIDALVIGFTESTEDRQGMLHDLLLGIGRDDGTIHLLGRVGGGFSEEQRRTMLSDLNDMVVESEYAEVNSDHVAYQMVEPNWVVEISCLDLIAQNTRGGPVNRMVLSWNKSASQYEVVRRMPLVSVISPQFLRLREDKDFKTSDIRIGQITDIVPVPMSNVVAAEMTLPKSEVLEREVYTKVLRGETMVRKFLMWKTNKQNESEDFPAFVIHYTDFSPSRKTPLNREVRVSNSQTQVIALWHGFKESYIKKGWELHSRSGSFVIDVESEIAAAANPAGDND
ncbi:MAG: hypothetical protein AAF456_20545 [Planctomycetota bacterium]